MSEKRLIDIPGLLNLVKETMFGSENEPNTRRGQAKTEKAQQIRKAALRVFQEKGYHKSSISDILRYTDIARGTFYLYYNNKAEIFDDLLADLYRDIIVSLAFLNIDESNTRFVFFSQLKTLAQTLLKIFLQHKQLVSILVSSSIGRDSIFDRRVEGFYEVLSDVVKSLTEKGVAAGHLREHNTELLARLLIGGLKEVLFHWFVKNDSGEDIHDQVDQLVEIFMQGVQKPTNP